MLILGLDPGSLHTGYGLVEKQGSSLVVREVGRISCRRELPLPERLAQLARRAADLVAQWHPDLAAVESPFHGLNSRSLIILAQARGALLAVVAGAGIAVQEYTPAEVKSAVTGNGRADKEQVARMLGLLLAASPSSPSWAPRATSSSVSPLAPRAPFPAPPASRGLARDATDALAVAVCCAHRLRLDRLREGLK